MFRYILRILNSKLNCYVQLNVFRTKTLEAQHTKIEEMNLRFHILHCIEINLHFHILYYVC